MKFKVFDNKTGKEADPYEIALHEEWAQGLVYCDMEGFAITEDGYLVLMDECGHVVYCDTERFKVVFEEERPHGEWLSHYDYCKKHDCIPSGLIAFWWCNQCEQGVEIKTNFCPNCGADMRPKEGDENDR